MNYDQLLDGCGEIGRCMLTNGAEIYRVEDTVRWVMASYGVQGEVFAIPNQLTVSLTDEQGRNYTRLYRTFSTGTDIEVIEQFNGLSRAIYADPPPVERLVGLAEQTLSKCRAYSTPGVLLGYLLGAFFFTLFFQGNLLEALVAGLAGMASGYCSRLLGRFNVNFFFRTVAAALVLGLVTYGGCALGLPLNSGIMAIGAVMVLVPGLVFTTFMADLITSDILSGITTCIQAVLTVTALVIGTGTAVYLYQALGLPIDGSIRSANYGPFLQCLTGALACLGFCMMYNVHGIGILPCCLGGALGWGVYLAANELTANPYICYLCSAVVIAIYAEIMARLRKYPTTAYLVVSYFPLVPGSYIYYAMYYSIRGDWHTAFDMGARALGLAACLAMGTLLVSTTVRTVLTCRRNKRMRKQGKKL